MIVDVPGEGVYSYHLRPPEGGEEWTAPRDATTLHPADGTPFNSQGGGRL
ncbi:hypothetical protein [Streptomyces tateyamensis]|nr:hypothetical protein [Streptomyces tateyamensis]